MVCYAAESMRTFQIAPSRVGNPFGRLVGSKDDWFLMKARGHMRRGDVYDETPSTDWDGRLRVGSYRRAVRYFAEYEKRLRLKGAEPSAEVFYEKGNASPKYFGDWMDWERGLNEAKRDWKHALELEPNISGLPVTAKEHYVMGVVHYEISQWEKAAGHFERAIQLEPLYGEEITRYRQVPSKKM